MSEFLHNADALLVFKDDIENRNFWDWIKARAAFSEPLHKYRGVVRLNAKYFEFEGNDRETSKPMLLTFNYKQLADVFLGFDNVFTTFEDRSLGLTYQPLRMRIENGNHEFVVYIIFNYNRFMRTADNRNWFEVLSKWQKGVSSNTAI